MPTFRIRPENFRRPITYRCAGCGQPLTQRPEKTDAGWLLPCTACSVKNLILPLFKLVDWH
jgi:DNA-directed RNA polymerase subunit RPC12/RpoP